jgi:hypothetical protein
MQVWKYKTPDETVSRRWNPDVDGGESIQSATVAVDSGTVTATVEVEASHGAHGVNVLVSGGAAGEVARVSVTAITSDGSTLVGVFQIPVRAEASVFANTARNVCDFALRKIVGNNGTASATELSDAMERLNAILALWRLSGMDVGVSGELSSTDTLTVPDAYLTAIKYALRRDLHDYYNVPLSANDVLMAQQAEAAVLADTINLQPLDFDRSLLRRHGGWDYTQGR